MALPRFDVLGTITGGVPIQSFPLVQGKLNKTQGATSYTGRMIHCVEDGDIVITWPDGTTETVSISFGSDFSFLEETSFVISSGKFHYV